MSGNVYWVLELAVQPGRLNFSVGCACAPM